MNGLAAAEAAAVKIQNVRKPQLCEIRCLARSASHLRVTSVRASDGTSFVFGQDTLVSMSHRGIGELIGATPTILIGVAVGRCGRVPSAALLDLDNAANPSASRNADFVATPLTQTLGDMYAVPRLAGGAHVSRGSFETKRGKSSHVRALRALARGSCRVRCPGLCGDDPRVGLQPAN
jgi:hypothetical protein